MKINRINVQLLHRYDIYKSISYVHNRELSIAENGIVVFASSASTQHSLEDKMRRFCCQRTLPSLMKVFEKRVTSWKVYSKRRHSSMGNILTNTSMP